MTLLATFCTMLIASPAMAQTTRTYQGNGQTIADNASTYSSVNLQSLNVTATRIEVTLNGFSHTYIGDLVITLSHGGTNVVLHSRECGGADAGGTVTYADRGVNRRCETGTYVTSPYQLLSAFDGKNALGEWRLTITDQAGGDTGRIDSWTLAVTYNGSSNYKWVDGAWSAYSTTCGQATRTRTVTCQGNDGFTYEDAACTANDGPKHDTTETTTQTSSCTYSWKSNAWQQVPACGTTTETRTNYCQRSDGTTVADSSCTGTRPTTTQPSAAANYQTCTYEWNYGAWSEWSTTCGRATHTRTYNCKRSDGTIVSNDRCSYDPYTVEAKEILTSCTYDWKPDVWRPLSSCGAARQYRTLTCTRSDGTDAASYLCDGRPQPDTRRDDPAGGKDYSACTYSWTYGAWGSWDRTCGQATRARTSSCLRSDGTTVPDAQCPSYSRSNTDSELILTSCTYGWAAGPWTDLASCGAARETRGVTCGRSDGTNVDSSLCTGQKPESIRPAVAGGTNYAGCGYAWVAGAWSAIPGGTCGLVARTRAISCQRDDGQSADASRCENKPQPAPADTVRSTAGCGYSWSKSGYALSACVNDSQTFSPTYTCYRSDGQMMDPQYCAARQPTTGVQTASCDAWRQRFADPDFWKQQFGDTPFAADQYRLAQNAVTAGTTGTARTGGTGQTPVTPTGDGVTEGAPGANTGGVYDAATGDYVTKDGQKIAGGVYDEGTRTYWDSETSYRRWKALQPGGGVVVFRRVLG